MYRCVCHSCRDEDLVETLDRAQEFFGHHADLGCEVELFKVEASDSAFSGESILRPSGSGSGEQQPADE